MGARIEACASEGKHEVTAIRLSSVEIFQVSNGRAKLEGRLINDLYYPCGGDRSMLKGLGIGCVDLFQLVRNNPSNQAVLAEVRKRRKKPT